MELFWIIAGIVVLVREAWKEDPTKFAAYAIVVLFFTSPFVVLGIAREYIGGTAGVVVSILTPFAFMLAMHLMDKFCDKVTEIERAEDLDVKTIMAKREFTDEEFERIKKQNPWICTRQTAYVTWKKEQEDEIRRNMHTKEGFFDDFFD